MLPITLSLGLMSLAIIGTFFLAYKRKLHPLGTPILGAGIFGFIYVFQPAYLLWKGDIFYFLTNWQIAKGILVALLMFLFFLGGWFYGSRNRVIRIDDGKVIIRWEYRTIYKVGFLLALVGTGLFYLFIVQSGGVTVFYGAPHATLGAWEEQTAYLYMSRYFVYPGLVLMILSLIRLRARRLMWLPIVLFSLTRFAHAILASSRGEYFVLTITLVLSYYLVSRKIPKVRTVLLGGIVVGLGILLLVGYRDVIHLGPKEKPPPSFREGVLYMTELDEADLFSGQTGIEFIYHSGTIDAVDKLQKYHLGLNWLYLTTVHAIPRLLWKDKPYRWDTPGVMPEDFYSLFGWVMASGSANGLVGDIYSQFGLASVAFFFFLGWLNARMFVRAVYKGDPASLSIYILWYAWGLNLFGQGFGALLVPYLFVLIPTLILIQFCKKTYRKVPAYMRGPTAVEN